MANFQAGSLVKLKSGGPEMTVLLEDSMGQLYCAWFPSWTEAPMYASFPAAALKPSEAA